MARFVILPDHRVCLLAVTLASGRSVIDKPRDVTGLTYRTISAAALIGVVLRKMGRKRPPAPYQS